ncbi:MAG: P-loop NTPase fold protein, partial [Candidatus Hodarchaeales archaeon]
MELKKMFNRQLTFILLGNKGSGKTTLIKLLSDESSLECGPTTAIVYYSTKIKLSSSRKSGFFSFERWRR